MLSTLVFCPAEDCLELWMVLAMVPANDIRDVDTGAMVLGDVTVRFSMESGRLRKNKE